MQIDLNKTFALVRGGLTDHEKTWTTYFEQTPVWKETATVLTGPVLLANVFLSMVFAYFSGGYAYFAPGHGFIISLVIALCMAVVGLVVATVVFNTLAGVFGGKPDFSRAFAAVSFAMIPAWLAGIIGALIPGIGMFISLAGGIVALIFLYKIMPLALQVPDQKRVLHYVLSIVLVIVVQMIFMSLIGGTNYARQADPGSYRSSAVEKSSTSGFGGVVGELERQGRLQEAAEAAEYDPPGNGELKREQVQNYVKFMKKTQQLQEENVAEMKDLADKVERQQKDGEQPSTADLTRMYSGVGSAMGLNHAEVEIVITGGGNWAEHQWVKEQLRVAKIQRGEGPGPIAHNYEIYLEFKDELATL